MYNKMLLILLSVAFLAPARAQTQATDTIDSEAVATVSALYEQVTFPVGSTPDWQKVRALFIEEAVIVLRTKLLQH